jgi:hypothetical protein
MGLFSYLGKNMPDERMVPAEIMVPDEIMASDADAARGQSYLELYGVLLDAAKRMPQK